MIGKKFIYREVQLSNDRTILSFTYRIDTNEQSFDLTETLTLPKPLPDTATAANLLRALHIALGISYYKTFIPPVIEHSYTMDSTEAEFWNDVFRNGLGEFLHINNLRANQIASFTAQGGKKTDTTNTDQFGEKALLGIGGGKDSIVAGELLKEVGISSTGFVLATGNNTGQASAVADVMGIDLLQVQRSLDRQILDMNKLDGAYNGHVPISLVFALIGCILGCVEKARYVVVANEASASLPQTEGADGSVNHQWSKSFEFEKSFQEYVRSYISADMYYFSAIRSLNSLSIAKIFCSYPQYFSVFTSDNSVFRIIQGEREHPRWSLESPKSLSSFILLGPWLTDDALLQIFGRNLLNEPMLASLLLDLLGATDQPVLDCVGTPEELRLSLSMLAKQTRFSDSALMVTARKEALLDTDCEEKINLLLKKTYEDVLPANLATAIHTKIQEKL